MLLQTITDLLDQKETQINTWFESQWTNLKPLPYFSCDIRHSSTKMGIVDTNLFPGGFNNLCSTFSDQTAKAFQTYFKEHYPQVKKVILLSENHTRNKFYLLNIKRIQDFLITAGLECHVTLPLPKFPRDVTEIPLDDQTLTIHAIDFDSKTPKLKNDFEADLVLSNNDMSAGLPDFLSSWKEHMIPSEHLGWHKRLKSNHFSLLCKTIYAFCKEFEIDSWLLCPLQETVREVTESSLEPLKEAAEKLFSRIQKKYLEHNIPDDPYIFVKNDSGTYGLGVVSIKSPAEILELGRKQKQKLFAGKAGVQKHQFLLQEGIPTTDTYSGHPIEPVIYGVGKNPVGGFFRIHESKDPYESLNAPGMSFSCLCLHKLDEPHESHFIDCKHKKQLVKVSNLLAKFAALACAKE